MLNLDHKDGKPRCTWCGYDDFYVKYHDEEWGVPEWDSRALYEKFILDGFQAGLSWITILKRREGFRQAFDGFEPSIIANYSDAKIEELMLDTRIIRNRAKIINTVKSAQIYLEMEAKGETFRDYLWNFYDGKPRQNEFKEKGDVPPSTPHSEQMAKEMKKRGFNFCGPTIIYAFAEAVGMVNDHLTGCYRYEEIRALGK
jgi:DNA-3-methyladenine glycosylase I